MARKKCDSFGCNADIGTAQSRNYIVNNGAAISKNSGGFVGLQIIAWVVDALIAAVRWIL